MDYTKSQREAINSTDKNLQIIACAGSGKTQVISARIVEILKEGNKPANIVAFTFTDKAAGELKDRIYRLCNEELGSQLGLAEMFIGTIHGYCLNLLQSPPLYRFLKYTVLTDVQQRLLIDRYSQQSGLTEVPFLRGEKLKRWRDSSLYQQLVGILGEGNVDSSKINPTVLAAVGKYYELCDTHRYLDYTMIIAHAVAELKKNDALREKIAGQLKYLIVDEYQDVNPLQEMLIWQLYELGANICVVGDDDQTIYQWRGSDVSNIIRFVKRYSDVWQVSLNENFRSSSGIVRAARLVIERNPQRLPKKMESVQAQPYQRGEILALDFHDPDQEAFWIAKKIQSLYGVPYTDKPDAQPRGLSYADFAVLLRSVRNDAGPIITALEAADIPYIVGGMNGLFSTKEIQVMCSVFYFLADFAEQPVTAQLLERILEEAELGLTQQQMTAGLLFLHERKAQIGQQREQQLYLQRIYLDFLKTIELREETVQQAAQGSRSGEIVFYNLGKFSQVISDFEGINFNSAPGVLYPAFANFLYYQASSYYPEGWEDAGYARPDAVQIMTVHQAKGMQWPAVFVPCLRNNRFPSQRRGGLSVWHILPEESVENVDRYKGTVEDERRLFYVALTRAEKYLFCSWAPLADKQNQRRVSPFFSEFTNCDTVLTREPQIALPTPIPSKARKEVVTLELTFSELKYYFDCPYSFKLRFLYGFNPPIDQALGYGKSLHDALAEIHAESIKGNIPTIADVPELVEDHLYLPFAGSEIKRILKEAANTSLMRYLRDHQQDLSRLEHAEKVIELKLDEGIVVSGRIDLIRRTDTDEVVIVDFKTDKRAQEETITQKQLHIYAVGYEQLTGKQADLIEIHNLDGGGARREMVDEQMMESTLATVVVAGQRLRKNDLPRLTHWCDTCSRCDLAGICRSQSKARISV
jgi:DNA helicase II / ATP-dependent DNA helicase PcrA